MIGRERWHENGEERGRSRGEGRCLRSLHRRCSGIAVWSNPKNKMKTVYDKWREMVRDEKEEEEEEEEEDVGGSSVGSKRLMHMIVRMESVIWFFMSIVMVRSMG